MIKNKSVLAEISALVSAGASGLVPLRSNCARKRLHLWELGGGAHCSVIGTCLSEADLVDAMTRTVGRPAPSTPSYEIHAFCVQAAGEDKPLARTLHKMLDKRHEGALRLVAKATTGAELDALWQRLRDEGQIGGAYWAMLSHVHVGEELRSRMFGDVHMLSHLHGKSVHGLARKQSVLETELADMQDRLKKADAARAVVLAEIAELKRQVMVASQPAAGVTRTVVQDDSRLQLQAAERDNERLRIALASRDRALASARHRARIAESLASHTNSKPAFAMKGEPNVAAAPSAQPSLCACCRTRDKCRLNGQRVLYIGGRSNVVPHLRSAAEERDAVLLHHDGGIENSVHRIEELVSGCDAVICPIDCVSHAACLLAKELCRKFDKPFMPVPTSSRSGFERALEQLSAATAPRQ